MNYEEYKKVEKLNYEEYCEYLQNKYGFATENYFTKNWVRNKNIPRDSEGLFCHHKAENIQANLSNDKMAKMVDPDQKYQSPEYLVYCDYLEHLLLHILIGEQTDSRKALGMGGAVNFLIPGIEAYLTEGVMNENYNSAVYENIDKRVFNELKERCDKTLKDRTIALDHNIIIEREMENYLNTKNKALIVLGTGLGKTTTALQYLWANKCRALVVCPNNLIVDGWNEYSDWVDTTTYQSFANKYKGIDYSQYGLVILDEAHHADYDEEKNVGAEVWSKGIKYVMDKGIKVLGLTATPGRSDGLNISESMFKDCVCEGLAVEDAIEQGKIHAFSYITAYYDTDGISEEYSQRTDNTELIGQLDLAIQKAPTMNDILLSRMPMDVKRKGIIFVQDIADMDRAKNIMKSAFPNVAYKEIHSKMSLNEVEENKNWFENIDEGYLLAVNMISEGAHYKGVNTLIMLRRTASYSVFTQQLGRIITLTRDEDPHAIVFDLVNNIFEVDYNNTLREKNDHSIRKIVEILKKSDALKSDQIIIDDETQDIVECIKKIKAYEDDSWLDWEDEIIRQYYPTEGPKGCMERINARRKELGI